MTRFPTTRWTLVQKAARESHAGSREQLGQLLERYWLPMFTHLRLKGVDLEKAEDLIQDFMVEILNRDLLAIADPKKGKLRTLLLTALDRFAISQHRRETAAKRSPGKIASLDVIQTDEASVGGGAPGNDFDRAWALDVLSQSLADMQRECEDRGDEVRWQVFEQRILGPLLDDAKSPSFADLAAEFGLPDQKTAMNRLTTAKRQFARHVRGAVRGYVRPGEIEEGSISAANRTPQVTRSDTDIQVSYQLAEHSARQDVEREIDELRTILARSRSALSIVGDIPHETLQKDPTKYAFWQRLTRQYDTGDPALAEMFDLGIGSSDNDNDDVLGVYFTDTLDTDLRSFAGLEYEGPGTLRELLDDPLAPIELLQRVKDWVNISRLGNDAALPETLANGLYFLVLAAALVHGGRRITGLVDHELRTGQQWLLKQTWFEVGYRPLVEQALDMLG